MRSRLAPSPTGALHVGNARTFLLNWLHVRHAGGTILLRIDDLDSPRVKRGAGVQAVEDLRWLGLDWDNDVDDDVDENAGDNVGDNGPPLVQSERAAVYDAAAQRLVGAGLAYPCVCTRSEVETAASAPHGPEGARYPGTCRGRWPTLDEAAAATGRPAALRFTVTGGPVAFDDLLYGPQTFDPAAETGDFVIRKSSGTAAYQLATVVDDAATGIDLVVRGADLLPSTARQILLQRALGLPHPSHLHLPLVVGPDGRRLAKRHGDTSIQALRAAGWAPDELVGWLAASAGIAVPGERGSSSSRMSGPMSSSLSTRMSSLVAQYDPAKLSRSPVTADATVFVRRPSG